MSVRLQRAKRQTLDKLEKVVRLIENAKPDDNNLYLGSELFRNEMGCGFCEEYRGWYFVTCGSCPICRIENDPCYMSRAYQTTEMKILCGHPDAIPDLLAMMIYIHQLGE